MQMYSHMAHITLRSLPVKPNNDAAWAAVGSSLLRDGFLDMEACLCFSCPQHCSCYILSYSSGTAVVYCVVVLFVAAIHSCVMWMTMTHLILIAVFCTVYRCRLLGQMYVWRAVFVLLVASLYSVDGDVSCTSGVQGWLICQLCIRCTGLVAM